jgi:hypothetical protein
MHKPVRHAPKKITDCFEKNGAPERIRTSDPQIRSLVLYPAELRVLACVPLAAAMGG